MMTREYPRYALMAAALGFWIVLVSVGGMVGLYCLMGSLPSHSYFFVLHGCIFVGGHYFPLIGVAELGSRLAAKAPPSCSVSAGLLPLLPAILALAFLPAELARVPSPFAIFSGNLYMLQYLRTGACLLYALFLLAFCFSSHARKKTVAHGEEERPAAASDAGTAAQAYRRYLVAAVAVSIYFLPFCALVGMLFLKGYLDDLSPLFPMVIIGLCFGILAACGCWLAARAQAAAACLPGFKPLLLPALLFFCLSLPNVYFLFVGSVIPRNSAAWLIPAFLLTYVLFLLLFHTSAGAGKRKKPSGGQQPASPHGSDTTKKGYRHYLITAVVLSVFFLPFCAALNLYAVDGFFALCGSPFLVLSDGSPFVLKEIVGNLPFSGGILAAVVCCGLTVPAVCGGCLAARAQAAPTFSARYLPLLLLPLLFLSVLTLCACASFDTIPLYKLMTLTFALTYGLFLLAFRLGDRKQEPARGRRTGLSFPLLALAPFCVALAATLPAVLSNTVDGEEDAVRKPDFRHYVERFSPSRPDNDLALPAVPPSLRLAAPLPRLDGTLAALPLYAAAFQAVTCLDEDGRPLSAGERDKRLAGKGVSCSERYSLQRLIMFINEGADIFFGPPPSKDELDWLNALRRMPDVRPVAREGLVFFVHKDNPVKSLSREQLRRIYTGEITNWKDVGGRDERILPFQHEERDENQRMLEELILRGEEAAPPLREKYLLLPLTVDERVPRSMVARYRKRSNALGFGLRWYLDKWFPDGDFRLLAVDGVPPTDATLRDGSYPLTLPLCLIACRSLSVDGRAFRDWLLGPEGRDLIRRAGYLPWNDENDGRKAREDKEDVR